MGIPAICMCSDICLQKSGYDFVTTSASSIAKRRSHPIVTIDIATRWSFRALTVGISSRTGVLSPSHVSTSAPSCLSTNPNLCSSSVIALSLSDSFSASVLSPERRNFTPFAQHAVISGITISGTSVQSIAIASVQCFPGVILTPSAVYSVLTPNRANASAARLSGCMLSCLRPFSVSSPLPASAISEYQNEAALQSQKIQENFDVKSLVVHKKLLLHENCLRIYQKNIKTQIKTEKALLGK